MEKKNIKHENIIDDVISAKNGNTKSMEKILEDTEHIIYYTIKNDFNRIRINMLDLDDINQELKLATVECVKNFDIKNHNDFVNHLFAYLKYALYNYIYNNVNYIDKHDYKQGVHQDVSLFTQTNDSDSNPSYLMDTILDENTIGLYEKIDDEISDSAGYIRKILLNFISNDDIDYLFNFYNITDVFTLEDLSNLYGKSVGELITYERFIILVLTTNKRIYDYYEQLMSNVSINYNYSLNRFKNTFTSSTEYVAIKNIMLNDKIKKELEKMNVKTIKNLHRNIIDTNKDFEHYRFNLMN